MDAKKIISKMTLQEKIAMLIGDLNWGLAIGGCERLGLNGAVCTDGPLGVRDDVKQNCTAFPCGTAMAATWNKELIEKMGAGIANDCIKHDKDILLGPGVNIKRTPLCGRNFEYFSEDPVLSGKIAAAYIRGVQSKGVGTCIKHFAANNQEIYRGTASADVDERTLRDIYLKPFKIAVKEANPTSIMLSYNRVNGLYNVENPYLLKTVLREDWNYDGVALSDWYAVKNPVTSFLNGLNLQMPYQGDDAHNRIEEAVKQGIIKETEIEETIYPLVKFLSQRKKADISYDRDAQHEIAKETAQEGIVLLKNENATLPITGEKYKNIVVIGGFAENHVYYGYGSAQVCPNEAYIDSPIEKIKANLDGKVNITYIKGYEPTMSSENTVYDWRPELSVEAGAQVIKDADLVVMFMGHPIGTESEESDLPSPYIHHYYNAYITRVLSLNKNLAVVLQTGTAIVPHSWNDIVPCVVQMWMAGEAGGEAIADVLCGKVSPSGKLPETFARKPRSDFDYPGTERLIKYDEKWAVGYRYYDLHTEDIAYPFGHGLSYTDFKYSDFKVNADGDNLIFSFAIKNTGSFPAKETAQIYFSKNDSFISRPKKELLDFYKTKNLQCGETEKIELTIPVTALEYFNCNLRKSIVESGVYTFYLASSSADIRLECTYTYDETHGYTMHTKAFTAVG